MHVFTGFSPKKWGLSPLLYNGCLFSGFVRKRGVGYNTFAWVKTEREKYGKIGNGEGEQVIQ